MLKPGRRPRQIACLVHVVLAGAGAAALGAARDLSGPGRVRYLVLLAIGVAAVLHVLDPKWPAVRRHSSAWVAGLLVAAGLVAVFIEPRSDVEPLGVAVAIAWCLACALGAAATVSMLGHRD